MDYLMECLFRLGSFTVLVQTLLHFTEGKAYRKYIEILSNIMILSIVLIPCIELFHGGTGDRMKQLTAVYEKEIMELNTESDMENGVDIGNGVGTENATNLIIQQIPIEIKTKLNKSEIRKIGYRVNKVVVDGIRMNGSFDENRYQVSVYLEGDKGVEVEEAKKSQSRENQSKDSLSKESQGKENQSKENLNQEEQEQQLRSICAQELEVEEHYVEVIVSE